MALVRMEPNTLFGLTANNFTVEYLVLISLCLYPCVCVQVRRHRRFHYALGPAYCISKELMLKLPPYFRSVIYYDIMYIYGAGFLKHSITLE